MSKESQDACHNGCPVCFGLDKLKLNIRSLIASQEEDSKDLLDLCIDVIYHNNMKAFGLQQLIKLYLTWLSSPEAEEEEE